MVLVSAAMNDEIMLNVLVYDIIVHRPNQPTSKVLFISKTLFNIFHVFYKIKIKNIEQSQYYIRGSFTASHDIRL